MYPVRILDASGATDVTVANVDAVNGNNTNEVARCIAGADIMATAVGVNILKFIVPNLVAGIRLRFAQTDRPLNIIICENLNNANKILEGMLKERLTDDERSLFDQRVGLVEASIGRMVPIQTEEMRDGDPLRVCVESYGFLPVDRDGFQGQIPEIQDMIPFSPFDYFVKRKLFVHNMGHACCAYLGALRGYGYIWQAIADPGLYSIVQNAMEASAFALAKKYGVEIEGIFLQIQDLLFRFRNAALQDTCNRVGREPARKLSADDRLIGSYRLCREMGIDPSFICLGIAAALHRYLAENGLPQTGEQAAMALETLSGCSIPAAVRYYDMLRQGCFLSELRAVAEKDRHATLGSVL